MFMPVDAQPSDKGNIELMGAFVRPTMVGSFKAPAGAILATVHTSSEGSDRHVIHHVTCPHPPRWQYREPYR